MTESKIFIIIAGDLVGSRNVSHRQQLSDKIRSVIDQITREFRDEFYAPPVLTRGIDELSGVFKRPNMSYRICKLLNDGIYPYLFRFALVRGVLDVAVDSRDASRMDGPAFHIAADLIQRAKKENLYYCFNLELFQVKEFDQWLDEFTNLIHIVRSDWTEHQRKVVQLYERLENQQAVARELGITQQAVSDALGQAHWKEVTRAENIVDRILGKYGSNRQNNSYPTKQTRQPVGIRHGQR